VAKRLVDLPINAVVADLRKRQIWWAYEWMCRRIYVYICIYVYTNVCIYICYIEHMYLILFIFSLHMYV
jgi:hypothetical protein